MSRWGLGVIAALAVASCSSSHASDAAAPGTLDAGFGSGGKVSTDLGSPADHARAVAVQPDGKIVVAGATQDPAQGDNFALVRYTTDGKLDTGFGDGGRVSTDFGGKADVANAVVIQPDGKIVAAGTSHGTASGDNIALARYTSDGKLDSGFGDGGRVSADLGTQADHANTVAVQSDGRIVVAGSTHDPVQGDNFVVLRYNADGKPDAGFGDGGKVSTDFGGKADVANAVVIQPDGKIVAAGTSHGTASGDNIALARYTSDGKLDNGFGDDGKVSTDLGAQADHANAVAVLSDGRIVVAGSTRDPVQGDNFVLVGYTTDGKSDNGFGDKGKVSTDFGGKADIAYGLAIAPGGKLLAAGTSTGTATGDNVAVARYTPEGKLDNGFGDGGKVSTDLGTKADRGTAVAVQRDGKVIVVGSTADPQQGNDFLAIRYNG
ncbi:WD40 repeat domain-containing protein [Nocardia sp. NPDC051570]|uniref:WD40 repeat domain-containing protein n=1 Tax=Nocardia sp. NPDC051570 TaxID=3364324 RepID=UPI0037B12031